MAEFLSGLWVKESGSLGQAAVELERLDYDRPGRVHRVLCAVYTQEEPN